MLAQKQDDPSHGQRGKQEVNAKVLGAVHAVDAILPRFEKRVKAALLNRKHAAPGTTQLSVAQDSLGESCFMFWISYAKVPRIEKGPVGRWRRLALPTALVLNLTSLPWRWEFLLVSAPLGARDRERTE